MPHLTDQPIPTAAPVSSRVGVLAWLGCAALVLVASRGIWPISPVEGDDQGVIFGLDGMLQSSPDLLARRYLFPIQPGTYDLLATVGHWTGAPGETVFAVATIFGAALFAGCGAWILSTVLSIRFAAALLALLWCQETVAAACYLNTSALAGGVALLALVPFARGAALPWVAFGGLGLGVAGWLRCDALLISPTAFALLAVRRGFGWQSFRDTAVAAAVALATFAVLRQLSGASIATAFASYGELPQDAGTWRTSRDVVLTLMSPGLLALSAAGTAWLAWRRSFALLALVLLGVLPALLVYRGVLVSTKYLYCTLPFALLPAIALLRHLFATALNRTRHAQRVALAGFALVAAADLAAGVRVLPSDARYFLPGPSAAAVAITPASSARELMLGAGDVVANEDGFRVRTGHLFAPEIWRRDKFRQLARLAELRAAIDSGRVNAVYFAGWLPEQMVTRELFLAGFAPHEDGAVTRWRRGVQTIDACFLGHAGSSYSPLGVAAVAASARDSLFVGTFGGKVPPSELADGRRWHAASAPPEGFITLFRRD